MNNKLHIISFDIPYPPNYGGVMDVFHKLRHLHAAGLEVYLHCFQYGNRTTSAELEKFCKQVFYYKRTTGLTGLHFSLPYIVSSRRDKELLSNLRNIEAPILFEGLHTCYFLSHPDLARRFKMVRTHNIEHDYYHQLKQKTTSLFSKLYFSLESKRLENYESVLNHAQMLLPISKTDYDYFSTRYASIKTEYLPAFHRSDSVITQEGKGSYCLYHGSLDVPENIESVLFLSKKVWNHSTDIPLIIAGKNPSEEILALNEKNIQIIINPSTDTMQQLIQEAHIVLLPTFQRSGLKLKLLDSLFNGRYIICNQNMLFGTDLDALVHVAEKDSEFRDTIEKLKSIPYPYESNKIREAGLMEYNNTVNAQKIISILR